MAPYITAHNANFVTELAINGHTGNNEDNLVWIFLEYPPFTGFNGYNSRGEMYRIRSECLAEWVIV